MMSISPHARSVTRILRSDACQGIGFQISGTSYFGYHYGYTADLIDKGAILIGAARIDPMFAGAYDPNSQTLFLKGVEKPGFFSSADGQDTVVHECTHAILHFVKSGKLVLHKNDEFAAWLAPTIYRINAGIEVIGGKDSAPLFRKSLLFVAKQCIADHAFTVPQIAIDSVGNVLIGAEKARGVHHPEWEKEPLFRHTPKPDLPPLQPDPPWL